MSEIISNLKLHFPLIAAKVVHFRMASEFDVTLVMDDGSEMLYDDMQKTIRILPKDRNNMNESEFRSEFGKRLRQILYRKSMSQSQLAYLTDMSDAQLSSYISGKHTPSAYVVDKISKALGCSIDEFTYR